MHSKVLPWEFSKKMRELNLANANGVYSFFSSDICLLQELCSFTKIKSSFNNSNWKIITGKEANVSSLEIDLGGADLFSGPVDLFIMSAQDCSVKVQEYLIERNNNYFQKVVLRFDKNKGFFEKILTQNIGFSLNVITANFWEAQKLVEFFCDEYKVKISWQSQEMIAEQVGPNAQAIKIAMQKILNLNLSGSIEDKLAEILGHKRIDFFHYGRLLGAKDFKNLLFNLQKIEDFDDLRAVLNFLRSYLLKLYSQSYTDKKKKLTQFDQEIIRFSTLWSPKAIMSMMEKIGNWEISAKSKDDNIYIELRGSYLKTFASK